MKIFQVKPDEHKMYVRELFTEYLRWAGAIIEKEYDYSFDINLIIEQNMLELEKFLPPEGHLLLAESENQIVGIVCMQMFRNDFSEIKRMYVRPLFRGKGIGRALLEVLIENAIQMGISRIRLDSARFMKAAHNLYHSFGFREIEPYNESEIPEEMRHNWIFMELILDDELKVVNQT